jgi:hypothetical protein
MSHQCLTELTDTIENICSAPKVNPLKKKDQKLTLYPNIFILVKYKQNCFSIFMVPQIIIFYLQRFAA